jgi:dipeptidyl aminopeptidase/acylaminoacyl peptidase
LERAGKRNIPVQPPFFPASFLDYISKHDPVSTAYTSTSPAENKFYGKKVLAVAGGKDPLVPWVHSERFFGELEVGDGTKDLFIDPEAGHELSPAMVDAIVKWLWKNALSREGQASL